METNINDPKFSFVLQSEKNQKKWQFMEKVFFYLSLLAVIFLIGSAFFVTSEYSKLFNTNLRPYHLLSSYWWAGFTFLMIGGFALKNICKEMSFITSMRMSIKYDSLIDDSEAHKSSLAKERLLNSSFYVAGYISLLLVSLVITYVLAFYVDYPLAEAVQSKVFGLIIILLVIYVGLVSMYHYFTNRLNGALGAALAEYQRNKSNES